MTLAENTTDTSPDINQVDYIIAQLEANDEAHINEVLESQHPAELADLLESLPPEPRQRLWKYFPTAMQGETLLYLGEEARASIIGEMEHAEVVAAAESMEMEDLAEVIDELPVDVSDTLIQSLDEDRRKRLEATLAYTEGSAGRLMTPDVISLRPTVSLGVVQRYLRRIKPLPAHTDTLMVIDENGVFTGTLPISEVITESPDSLVSEVMSETPDSVRIDASEHDIAMLFERRDLLSVGVVDPSGRLLGRITIDDVVDIIRSEADKALLSRAGLDEEEDLFAPVVPSAQRRAIWLGINLVTVFMAAWVIGQFEAVLDKIVALAVLMPVVASMGGIAGSQTLTLTIRGLALGQVSQSNLRWLGDKELKVGLLNGCVWSLVVAVVTYAWFEDIAISLIIAVAMLFNLLAAAFSGVLIPVILKRIGVDPALSGAVILTTVTDIIGFLSFLGLATLFLL